MKESSVIFADWSVLAILADRKTQTRRIMAVQPETDGRGMVRWPWQSGFFAPHVAIAAFTSSDDPKIWRYGRAGDRIRVKEAWRTEELRTKDPATNGLDGIRFRADNVFVPIAATAEAADRWGAAHDNGKHRGSWRSSMFLPRWASRTFLELTEVRVQRLHEISEEDAQAEGVEPAFARRVYPSSQAAEVHTYRAGYEKAWRGIHGEESWALNPWCFALTFKRIP